MFPVTPIIALLRLKKYCNVYEKQNWEIKRIPYLSPAFDNAGLRKFDDDRK